MSRGILKLETCARRGVPVKMPLLNPTKARKREYLEIRAYDNKVVNKDNDFTK